MGRVREGDLIEILIDTKNLEGTINLVGTDDTNRGVDWGSNTLSQRVSPDSLSPHPMIPDDSRLWAALQDVSGGTWGGCIFDVDEIILTLEAGKKVRQPQNTI